MFKEYAEICENELNGENCGLCARAISVLIAVFVSRCPSAPIFSEIKLTPIEQIFAIAYYELISDIHGAVIYPDTYSFGNVPLAIELSGLRAQERIDIGDKHYIADFEFSSPVLKNNGIVFELDGFDYHSTKEQMNRDYQRERELQMAGYTVMRFTGSQIYRTPFKCASEAIELIIDSMGGAVER